jgi:hypothetical protein
VRLLQRALQSGSIYLAGAAIIMEPASESDFSEILCIATEVLAIIQGSVPVDNTSWGTLKIK